MGARPCARWRETWRVMWVARTHVKSLLGSLVGGKEYGTALVGLHLWVLGSYIAARYCTHGSSKLLQEEPRRGFARDVAAHFLFAHGSRSEDPTMLSHRITHTTALAQVSDPATRRNSRKGRMGCAAAPRGGCGNVRRRARVRHRACGETIARITRADGVTFTPRSSLTRRRRRASHRGRLHANLHSSTPRGRASQYNSLR